jgi:hypothetical protein
MKDELQGETKQLLGNISSGQKQPGSGVNRLEPREMLGGI